MKNHSSPEIEASLRTLTTLDTLISRFLPFSGRLPLLEAFPDAFANSASPIPKVLAWLFGPFERRLLFAAHDTLNIVAELDADEPENVALRVMFGLEAVRVTLLEDDAEVFVFEFVFGVAERKVGIWNDEADAEAEREGRERDREGRFAAEEVEIGTCRLVVLRIHRRFLLEDVVALLEDPEANTS